MIGTDVSNDDNKSLKKSFEGSALAAGTTVGMTFLRLVPHEFQGALSYVKELRAKNPTSHSFGFDNLENALRLYLKSFDDNEFADERDFLIHDVKEMASLYGASIHARDLLITVRPVSTTNQPFLAHAGLRLIYDTLDSEDGWAIFRIDGKRAKLSKAALFVDVVGSALSESSHTTQGEKEKEFLEKLEVYKRELSEKEYAGASEISPELLAKTMDLQKMSFEEGSKEDEEQAEADKEEGQTWGDDDEAELNKIAEKAEAGHEKREDKEIEEEPEEKAEGEEENGESGEKEKAIELETAALVEESALEKGREKENSEARETANEEHELAGHEESDEESAEGDEGEPKEDQTADREEEKEEQEKTIEAGEAASESDSLQLREANEAGLEETNAEKSKVEGAEREEPPEAEGAEAVEAPEPEEPSEKREGLENQETAAGEPEPADASEEAEASEPEETDKASESEIESKIESEIGGETDGREGAEGTEQAEILEEPEAPEESGELEEPTEPEEKTESELGEAPEQQENLGESDGQEETRDAEPSEENEAGETTENGEEEERDKPKEARETPERDDETQENEKPERPEEPEPDKKEAAEESDRPDRAEESDQEAHESSSKNEEKRESAETVDHGQQEKLSNEAPGREEEGREPISEERPESETREPGAPEKREEVADALEPKHDEKINEDVKSPAENEKHEAAHVHNEAHPEPRNESTPDTDHQKQAPRPENSPDAAHFDHTANATEDRRSSPTPDRASNVSAPQDAQTPSIRATSELQEGSPTLSNTAENMRDIRSGITRNMPRADEMFSPTNALHLQSHGIAGRYDVLVNAGGVALDPSRVYSPTNSQPFASADLKGGERLYSVMTAGMPGPIASSMPRATSLSPEQTPFHTSDPAHDIAASLLKDTNIEKLSAQSGIKVRHPNLNHSFAEMFLEMPSLSLEPGMG